MDHIINTERLLLQPLCKADIGFMQELIALLKRISMYEEARLREVRMSDGVYCDEMVYSFLQQR